MLGLMEIKWVCVFPKYTIQKFIVKPQSASELILTPLSLFDLQCKKLNLTVKTSRNAFLGDLREGVFHIFPRFHSIMGQVPTDTF